MQTNQRPFHFAWWHKRFLHNIRTCQSFYFSCFFIKGLHNEYNYKVGSRLTSTLSFTKRIRYICQNRQTFIPFQDIQHFHQHIFSIILASYWSQQQKMFYPDSVATSRPRVWVHHQYDISVLLGALSLVKTNENHWGPSQSWKEGGSWFPSLLLSVSPSSSLPYGDKHYCHVVTIILLNSSSDLFLRISWCTSLWNNLT
jgi:hypothetical protein